MRIKGEVWDVESTVRVCYQGFGFVLGQCHGRWVERFRAEGFLRDSFLKGFFLGTHLPPTLRRTSSRKGVLVHVLVK
jgi:hypothetical protein